MMVRVVVCILASTPLQLCMLYCERLEAVSLNCQIYSIYAGVLLHI